MSPSSPSWASASCTSAMPAQSDGAPLRFDRTSTPGELVAKYGSLEAGGAAGGVDRGGGGIQTGRGDGEVGVGGFGGWGGEVQVFGQGGGLGGGVGGFLGVGG